MSGKILVVSLFRHAITAYVLFASVAEFLVLLAQPFRAQRGGEKRPRDGFVIASCRLSPESNWPSTDLSV